MEGARGRRGGGGEVIINNNNNHKCTSRVYVSIIMISFYKIPGKCPIFMKSPH